MKLQILSTWAKIILTFYCMEKVLNSTFIKSQCFFIVFVIIFLCCLFYQVDGFLEFNRPIVNKNRACSAITVTQKYAIEYLPLKQNQLPS